MGVGDFLSDIGDAIVPESVEDWAGGLAHGAQTLGEWGGNIAQGVGWAANPTHWDDIGRGIGNAAEFVTEHPGQTWDIGFEIGRHIVKEELLDPKNLAINLGLTAATVLTGGGAGAAWMAKMGKTGITALRATRVGARALRTAKEAEGAIAATRAIGTGARWAERAEDVVSDVRTGERVIEDAAQARRAIDRVDSFLSPNARIEGLKSRFSPGYRVRGALANRIEGQAPGAGRQMFADYVRQSATKPVFAEGTSRAAQTISTNAWRARRLNVQRGRLTATQTASHVGEEAFQASTNPLGYALGKARQFGLDPEGLARKAGTKAATKALEGGSEGRKRRPGDIEPMVPTAGMPSYGMPAQPSPFRATRSRGAVVSHQEMESVDTGPINVGRRRSAFYNGTAMAYGPQQSAYQPEFV